MARTPPPRKVPAAVPTADDIPHVRGTTRRVTFACPVELLADIETEMGLTGRSRGELILEAIRDHLDT